MSGAYRLRRVVKQDYAAVKKMHESLIGGTCPMLTDGFWWVLMCEHQYAGFCGVVAPAGPGRPCYLIRAAVLPEHRGRGLQRRMILTRLDRARREGWDTAVTYTLTSNAPSANSLIACGFRVYDPPYLWAGPNVIYWRRGTERTRRVTPRYAI